MRKLVLILSLLFSIIASGQTNNTELLLTSDSDTAFWKRNIEENISIFGLPKLSSESDFVFRIWESGTLLEITKTKDFARGKLIYFVFEVWEDDYEADVFVKEYSLPNSAVQELYKYITESAIKELPSDKFINGWTNGLDGITHIYELKEKSKYSFKNFWTPKIQNEIKEAELIAEFNQTIDKIIELAKYKQDFDAEVPFMTYRYPGSIHMRMKSMTKKEQRKYKRERRKRRNKR